MLCPILPHRALSTAQPPAVGAGGGAPAVAGQPGSGLGLHGSAMLLFLQRILSIRKREQPCSTLGNPARRPTHLNCAAFRSRCLTAAQDMAWSGPRWLGAALALLLLLQTCGMASAALGLSRSEKETTTRRLLEQLSGLGLWSGVVACSDSAEDKLYEVRLGLCSAEEAGKGADDGSARCRATTAIALMPPPHDCRPSASRPFADLLLPLLLLPAPPGRLRHRQLRADAGAHEPRAAHAHRPERQPAAGGGGAPAAGAGQAQHLRPCLPLYRPS